MPQLLICSGCVITFAKVFMCIILHSIILYSILLLLLSRFSRVRLCDPIDGSPPGSWDSPGKTGVGCHFLLQHMKVKSECEVIQLCLTLCHPMDCSLPGSSIHGIFQARVLEWGAIAFSKLYSVGIAKTVHSQIPLFFFLINHIHAENSHLLLDNYLQFMHIIMKQVAN